MPLPTAYGTIPLGGALPEAYIPVDSVPLLGGALESGYGEVSYAVNMTAAASGSNGITVADDDDIDFGTGDFFLHWEGSLDVAPPASIDWLYIKYQDGSNYWGMRRNTNGTLTFIAVVAGTTIISCTSSASPIVAGAIGKLTFCCTRESASANGSGVFYYNAASFSTASISAIAVRTINNSAALYISGDNAKRTASNTISCIVGNFAPTASEVLDLCTNGIPSSWKWGSQTATYTSNFSAGVDGFTGSNSAVAGNQDGIGGENDWLACTVDSVLGSHRAVKSSLFTVGMRYRVSGKLYIPSTNSNVDGVAIGDSGSQTAIITLYSPALDTIVIWSSEYTSSGAQLRVGATDGGNQVFQDAGGNDIFYLKDVVVTKIGATMALLPDTIPTSSATTWSDTSGNTGGGTLPAAGATKVTIRR